MSLGGTDRADNDRDLLFDCNDRGCFGSPDCVDSDGDGIPDDAVATKTPIPMADGTPDYLDDDADADSIPDADEGADDTDGDVSTTSMTMQTATAFLIRGRRRRHRWGWYSDYLDDDSDTRYPGRVEGDGDPMVMASSITSLYTRRGWHSRQRR